MHVSDGHPAPAAEPATGEVVEATEEERLAPAVALALAQINRRERTVAELRAHLTRRGIAEATAEAAVRELEAGGLVDDLRFAELYVADKSTLEGWGELRIRRGLAARGIERELIERVLAPPDCAGGFSGPSELERALELLRRRFPEPLGGRRERDRALGVLLRKGYDPELALDALAAHARGW